jgi:hypothetical protein
MSSLTCPSCLSLLGYGLAVLLRCCNKFIEGEGVGLLDEFS